MQRFLPQSRARAVLPVAVGDAISQEIRGILHKYGEALWKHHHKPVSFILPCMLIEYIQWNQFVDFKKWLFDRVESHHALLKKQLQSSMGNFETCWAHIHTLMEASHTAIKDSFERSRNVISHKFRVPIFQHLRGFVSSTALNLLHETIKHLPDGVLDVGRCGCVLRTTCGLPCPHELSEYVSKRMPIPLEEIDDFWCKMDMKPRLLPDADVAVVEPDMEDWLRRTVDMMARVDPARRRMMWKHVQETLNPSTTSLAEPSVPVRTKGRPKKPKAKGSTKREPSAFELVDAVIDSCSPADTPGPVIYTSGPVASKPMFTTARRPPKKQVSVTRWIYISCTPFPLHYNFIHTYFVCYFRYHSGGVQGVVLSRMPIPCQRGLRTTSRARRT